MGLQQNILCSALVDFSNGMQQEMASLRRDLTATYHKMPERKAVQASHDMVNDLVETMGSLAIDSHIRRAASENLMARNLPFRTKGEILLFVSDAVLMDSVSRLVSNIQKKNLLNGFIEQILHADLLETLKPSFTRSFEDCRNDPEVVPLEFSNYIIALGKANSDEEFTEKEWQHQ